ncbi:hypothetical protein [Bradyrhizobium sp. Gha]|nr:hypothetical protein [Bradyrhizobium sp. Gha]
MIVLIGFLTTANCYMQLSGDDIIERQQIIAILWPCNQLRAHIAP